MASLGRWDAPLEAEHEAVVLQLLIALITAVYSNCPTTIQQDRQLLAAAAAASAQVSAAHRTMDDLSLKGDEGRVLDGAGGAGSAAGEGSGGSGSSACLAQDVVTSVRFRLAMKGVLEEALKVLLTRKRSAGV